MPRGLNNYKMQQANRSLIISLIIKNPGISRIELANRTGLQKPTITNIVNELLEFGIVENSDPQKRGSKNKTKGLMFVSDRLRIISAMITREYFIADLYTITGTLVASEKIPICVDDDIVLTLNNACALINRLLNEQDGVLAMCLGVPGPYLKGEQERLLVEGFPQLSRVDVRTFFASRFDFPVVMEHDAHLSALCEWTCLNEEARKRVHCMMVMLTRSVGVGAGIILDGKIVEGAFGIAGEIGNIGININGPKNSSGERGRFEYYTATDSVRRYAMERHPEYPDTVLDENCSYEEILSAYDAGDALAKAAFNALAARIAYGLVSAIFVINPDTIVIGPQYPKKDSFLESIRMYMNGMVQREIMERINIRYSALDTDPALLGGYYYTLDMFSSDSTLLERIKKVLEKRADRENKTSEEQNEGNR